MIRKKILETQEKDSTASQDVEVQMYLQVICWGFFSLMFLFLLVVVFSASTPSIIECFCPLTTKMFIHNKQISKTMESRGTMPKKKKKLNRLAG